MTSQPPRIPSGSLPLPGDRRTMSNSDVALYISEMAGALAELSGSRGMPMLTYFLNMARVEADMQATQPTTLDERSSRLHNHGAR